MKYILPLSLLLLSAKGLEAAPNLLGNPGFEDGILSPWAAYNGSNVSVFNTGAFSGNSCGRSTSRTTSGQGIRQSVAGVAQPGRVHVGSAWVRTSSSTPVTVSMSMQQTDDRGVRFRPMKSIQVRNQWTKIEGYFEFDVKGTLTVLNFYFNGPPAGVDLFVDEASFSLFDTVAPENLLVNADFENETASWARRGTAVISPSPLSHTGASALSVGNRTQTWHGAEQIVTDEMEQGGLYYAAGWITTESATPSTARITLQVTDDSGTRFVGIAAGTVSSETWTWLSGSFRMPETSGPAEVRLFIEGPPAGVGMRADNFYLAPLTGLRRAAVAFPGIRLGAGSLKPDDFVLNEKFRSSVSANFHLASPANALKFSNTEPADGTWTFAEANSVIEFGLGRGGSTRGHAFVWHNGNPSWVSGGNFTPPELRTILWDQIDTKGAYYRGRLPWWDVVNEAVAEGGNSLRSTIWYDDPGIGFAANGNRYIRESFARARAADPSTLLFYNDYGIEEKNAKSDTVFSILSGLVGNGVPVHGIGFQSHLTGAPDGASVRTNFQRFNNLGLDMHVTELDFKLPVNGDGFASAADINLQGDQYFDYFGAVLGYSRMKVIQTWGVYDGSSWIPNQAPGFGQALPLDFNLDRKPAYWGIWNALAGQAEKLDVLAVSSGDSTPVIANTSDQVSGNAFRRLQANAAGDFMTLSFHVPFPGVWNVRMGVLRNPAGGTYQASFASPGSDNFIDMGGVRDTYSASNSPFNFFFGNRTFTSAGEAKLRIRVTGKNAASSGFGISADYIRLIPVNCSPVISVVPDQSIAVNTVMPSRLVIAEDDFAEGSLIFTASSSNTALLPNNAITIRGSSPYYKVAATPAAGQLGAATVTLTANDGSNAATRNFQLNVTGTPLQTWRHQNFGNTAETGTGADHSDPDNDGYVNLLEYALGTSPKDTSSSPTTTTPLDGEMEFIYTRDITTLGELSFTVQWSDTLHPDSWSDAGVIQTPMGTNGNLQTMKAIIPLPNNHKGRFARLKVSR